MKVFGILDLNVEKAVKTANDLDYLVDRLSDSIRKASLESWYTMEAIKSILRQKSMNKWIKEGD